MQKINFQDTEVVKAPYVEINGVEYEVESEYQGGTDLNAQVFNQMQDNIEDAIENIPIYDDTEMKTGWYNFPVEVTFTISSFDSTNHIAVLNTSVDLTEYIGVGTKLRFYNIGVAKYGIIIAITSSNVTVYLGTQSINEGAIEFPRYAITETPVDYPQYMSSLDKLYLPIEIPIGIRNNKPLYRYVVTLPNGTGQQTAKSYNLSTFGINNVEKAYITQPSYYTLVTGNNVARFPFNFYDGSKYTADIYNETQLRVELGYQYIWGNETVITIEYTKTTD